ncbi:MAG: phenylpyruvate tautomerase MIF-related protein [Myxococcota bacterium]|nr:phenylpyruvate tautomerase MIF-related protein [Myxococcota bacterium]
MPLLRLYTSVDVTGSKRDELLKTLSGIVAKAIGKPESYVMVTLRQEPICMGGTIGPSAFVDVYSIGGLSRSVNRDISKQVCQLLNQQIDVPTDRVYLNFTNMDRENWGWNSSTFG